MFPDSLQRPTPAVLQDIESAAAHVENSLSMPADDEASGNDGPLNTSTSPDIQDIPPDADEIIEDIDAWPEKANSGDPDNDIYDGVTGGVVEHGIDFVAFYKSFRDVSRRPAQGRWGIFFVKKRCLALASDIALNTGEPFQICLRALIQFLYVHELYHYKIDAYCLQTESTGGAHIYRPYRNLVKRSPISDWHEESVGNAYGLAALNPTRMIQYPPSVQHFLWDMVASSPGAYAGGVDKRQAPRKDGLAVQAAARFAAPKLPAPAHQLIVTTIRAGTNLVRSGDPTLGGLLKLENCPVYWIDWVKHGKSILVPQAVHLNELKGDFVTRYLAGTLAKVTDHTYYKIDNGSTVKLPNGHRAEAKNHEFQNIIGKAGMTSTEYFHAREQTRTWRKNVPRSPVLPPRQGF